MTHDAPAWCAQGRSVLGLVGDYLDQATCQSRLTGGKRSLLCRYRRPGKLSDAMGCLLSRRKFPSQEMRREQVERRIVVHARLQGDKICSHTVTSGSHMRLTLWHVVFVTRLKPCQI